MEHIVFSFVMDMTGISLASIGYCMDNDIVLMILPPHSSHLTKPLDVGVFQSLKKVMSTKLHHSSASECYAFRR